MRALLKPPAEAKILIALRDIVHLSSLSRETIRTLMNDGQFPRGFKLGTAPNSPRRWVRSEIVEFLERGLPAEEVTLGA